jgi:hypothetical protein
METKKNEIKADKLISFLKEIDKELREEIQLNAVGGTAMTLLGLKTSTRDVDFDVSEKDNIELKRVLDIIPHGFQVDIFINGLIFSQQLPEDYLTKLVRKEFGLKKIRLYALHPSDIVATKIGRLNERDIQDIEYCIKKLKLKKDEIIGRAKQTTYIGKKKTTTKTCCT